MIIMIMNFVVICVLGIHVLDDGVDISNALHTTGGMTVYNDGVTIAGGNAS